MKTALLVAALSCASVGLAAEPADYEGRFALEDRATADATLDAAIDKAAAQFPALIRAIAHSRLGSVVRASDTLTFTPGPNRMTVAADVNDGWTTDLAGSDTVVTDKRGDPVTLRRWMERGVLHAVASRENGQSTFRFVLDADGQTLVLHVETSSPQLAEPIRYRIVYRRTP